jgi:signal-transduction protein with cAMP-binding, CBS, and nucleotidyltransferase domain
MSTIRSILDGKGWTIHSVSGAATVFEAVRQMCGSHVGALLVLDNDKPTGIVSERDIMRRVLLERRDPSVTEVSAVMTRDLAFILLEAGPEEATALMVERGCRHLPVLHDGKVVGILSMGDLVRWSNRNHEHQIRSLQEYVSGVSS